MFRNIHNFIYKPIMYSSTVIGGSALCWSALKDRTTNEDVYDRITDGATACTMGAIGGFLVGATYPLSFPILGTTYAIHKITEKTPENTENTKNTVKTHT